jgi:hypothetical protein
MNTQSRNQVIDQISDLYEGTKDAINNLIVITDSQKDLPNAFDKLRQLRDIAAVHACRPCVNDFCRIVEMPEVNERALLFITENVYDEGEKSDFQITLKFNIEGNEFSAKFSGYKSRSEAADRMNSYSEKEAADYYLKFKSLLNPQA